jgi:uncharacterized protein
MRKLFLLLLIVSLSFAACPTAVRTINVPAVVGDSEGKLLRIEVSMKPGTGIIYTAIEPNIGITTQISQQTAARYAFEAANRDLSECDVTYRVLGSPSKQLVEGPSAGLAMAVATFAALKDEPLRRDVAITGTIEQDGSVGPVGGLVEKASAAADMGIRVLISPKQEVYEHLILSRLVEKTNITIFEATRLVDALQIVFAPEGTQVQSNFTLPVRALPSNLLAAPSDSELELFRGIANSLIEKNAGRIGAVSATDTDSKNIRAYFESEIANHKKLLELNYFFTAANSAFLLGADIEFFSTDLQEPDIAGREKAAQSCLLSSTAATPTDTNWQWAAAAQLRRSWSAKKLNETASKDPEGSEQTAVAVRDLLFVQNWCEVSRLFDKTASSLGGTPISGSSLEPLASEYIKRASDALQARDGGSTDSQWHLSVAREMYARGDYLGAIFDSTYAYTMESATGELEGNESQSMQDLRSAKYKYLWAKIYRDHGSYLSTEQGDDPSAYRILRFASELEAAGKDIESAMNGKRIPSQPSSTNESNYPNLPQVTGPHIISPVITVGGKDLDTLGAILYVIIVSLGFMIFYRFLKR